MVRGGKVTGKRNSRKRVRSNEGRSDDSDEDYVVSDDDRDVSDCPEDSCSSLDGCASEDSFDGFIGEEDDEEEQIPQVRRKFNRSKAKSGVCGQQKNASKTSRKRGRITYAEQLEEEEQEGDGDDDKDEDFNYDDDEEFTPEEEDYSDEEEETMERKKKDNSIKIGKKVLRGRASGTSTRGRKRRISRSSKKPVRKRRRQNGGLRRKVQCDDADDFIDNGPGIRINSRKKPGQGRRKLLLEDSNSDCEFTISEDEREQVREAKELCASLRRNLRSSSLIMKNEEVGVHENLHWRRKPPPRGRRKLLLEDSNSDCEFTISEDEREQVREAKELCGSLRRNLRSSSLIMKNEEVGVHENLHWRRKPPPQKDKEKIEEPQGRKGKEKVEDFKSEVGKQVCGICLSEENKRRLRGTLDCCTHYFCFPCIMEWSKVESRCPLCKQRFKTISKPAQSTAGTYLKEVLIQVPERDQVYQPSEEELRSYIDPYEYVICSECHQDGDDGLMLLCDICDSPAHTYCVGLGREVPEGNWYCDGCRPVALGLGSSNSQVQERVADPRVTRQSLPVRSSAVLNIGESIDLNLMSSPLASFSQAFGPLSSFRLLGRSVEGASPVPGGGAPTLSERRWIQRQIQQFLSGDRMSSTTGTTNGILATSSMNNLHSSQIDQSREPATQLTRTQDVGTSYHTFFEERLCNNISPFIQNGDSFSIRISNSRRQVIHDSTAFDNGPANGVLWPGPVGTPTISDREPVHQFGSRPNSDIYGNLPSSIKEDSNLLMVKEQLQSMVKSHLKSLSRDIDIGHSTFKDIAVSSMHTILAACGFEHNKNEVCTVPQPSVCPHMELMAAGHTSLIKGCCSSCFDSFVGDVVKRILDTKMSSQWLRLGL